MRLPLLRDARAATIVGGMMTAGLTFILACDDVESPPPSVPSITFIAGDTVADGSTVARFRIAFTSSNFPSDGKVTITTSAGKILGDTSPLALDASHGADLFLQAPSDSGAVLLVATAAGTRTERVVDFLPALANTVRLSTDAFRMPRGIDTSVSVTATLRRDVGTPTAGTQLTFSAYLLADSIAKHSVGVFNPDMVIATGAATSVKFSLGDSVQSGDVVLQVTATRGKPLATDALTLSIIPP